MSDAAYEKNAIKQQTTGLWDGTETSNIRQHRYAGRANLYYKKKPHRVQSEMWTEPELPILSGVVDQVEADHKKYDKYKLKIPRCKDGRTPWFWRTAHMPEDADMVSPAYSHLHSIRT